MYVYIYIYTLYIICAQTAVLSLWGSVNLSTFTSAFCEVFSLELVNMFSLCLRVYIQCMYIYIYMHLIEPLLRTAYILYIL